MSSSHNPSNPTHAQGSAASGVGSLGPLHEKLLSVPADEQPNSPLFRIPAEIRNHIFCQALTDYEEPSHEQQYERDSCWARPSYFSPRRTDVAILQTCRSIYRETWFLPFTLKEQTHWISSGDRAPPHYHKDVALVALQRTVEEIKKQRKEPTVDIESLRIFTQMYEIEDHGIPKFLRAVPSLTFQRLYITIRHADFWFWEDDEPLKFEGHWIPKLCRLLPSTVREVIVEMETVKRKENQLNDLANLMTQRWHFRTQDGQRLFADSTPNSCEITRWQGSSAWHNRRWVRDEISEGVIEYCVAVVRFKPQHIIERNGGVVSDEVLLHAEPDMFRKCARLGLHLPDAQRLIWNQPSVYHETEDNDDRIRRNRRKRNRRQV